jgi:hypothetical protein
MKLKDIAAGAETIPLWALSSDSQLVREVQRVLGRLGILDPPADGNFGPVSLLAWRTFAGLTRQQPNAISPMMAQSLLAAKAETLLPVDFGAGLADAIWQAMETRGYWLNRVPGWINIVYVEGANFDGDSNDNRPNAFNDLRAVVSIQEGRPRLLGKWEATSEPGKFYTDCPLNPGGAARIALNQFKAWNVGMHPGEGIPGAHQALVQSGVIQVFRDLNRDYQRRGDAVETGSSFGINQHWGYDFSEDDIGQASAGCLVGRTKDGHRKFMAIVKSDPRYLAGNHYRFMTAILTSADIRGFKLGLPT